MFFFVLCVLITATVRMSNTYCLIIMIRAASTSRCLLAGEEGRSTKEFPVQRAHKEEEKDLIISSHYCLPAYEITDKQ